jgi:transcriptional regulator with XRE-family HTH domain
MLRLRHWRHKRQLTLKDLAALTGISYQQLSSYERGDSFPSVQRLPILAQALGISIGQLFHRAQKPVLSQTVKEPVSA